MLKISSFSKLLRVGDTSITEFWTGRGFMDQLA